MLYAGLDIGTTGVKITIFNNGQILQNFYKAYDNRRGSEIDEIDANNILISTLEIIKKAYQEFNGIKAIGFTSFGESFVLLDKDDNILLPTMLYSDKRGLEETKLIKSLISEEKLGQITGLRCDSMFTLPKLLWVKNNKPEIYSQVKRICLIEDFITYSLTGKQKIDFSLASRTMLFDIDKCQWSDELFKLFDLDVNMFSKPVKIGTTVGNISDKNKKELGITGDISVIAISHDQIAAAIGSGLFEENTAMDGMGTCDCLVPIYKKEEVTKDIIESGFCVVPYIKKGFRVSYPLIFSGGALIDWFMKECANGINNPYFYFEHTADNNPSNLIFASDLLGSSTPKMNPLSKGLLYGLTINTNSKQIYKACLESVAFELLYNIKILNKSGIKIKKIIANGGGSRNELWLQIKADILNVPYYKLTNKDAGTIGSAIVIGLSIGLYKDYEEAFNGLVKIEKKFIPNKERHNAYMKLYKKYKVLYEFKNKMEENNE